MVNIQVNSGVIGIQDGDRQVMLLVSEIVSMEIVQNNDVLPPEMELFIHTKQGNTIKFSRSLGEKVFFDVNGEDNQIHTQDGVDYTITHVDHGDWLRDENGNIIAIEDLRQIYSVCMKEVAKVN